MISWAQLAPEHLCNYPSGFLQKAPVVLLVLGDEYGVTASLKVSSQEASLVSVVVERAHLFQEEALVQLLHLIWLSACYPVVELRENDQGGLLVDAHIAVRSFSFARSRSLSCVRPSGPANLLERFEVHRLVSSTSTRRLSLGSTPPGATHRCGGARPGLGMCERRPMLFRSRRSQVPTTCSPR